MRVLLRGLGYLWATPTTLLGLLFFLLPMWALQQIRPLRWHDGVWEWRIVLRSLFWKRYSLRGWSATTLGYCVFYSPGAEDRAEVAVHERRHVWQVMCLGPLFFPVYAVFHLIWGYQRNPLEVDAFTWEEQTRGG